MPASAGYVGRLAPGFPQPWPGGRAARKPALSTPLLLLFACSLVFALGVALFGIGDEPFERSTLSIGCAIDAILLVFALRGMGFAWQSGPIAYLIVLWMFHFPLTLMFFLGVGLRDVIPGYVLSWVEEPNWYNALGHATLCANAFALGCLMIARLPVRHRRFSRHYGFFCSGVITTALAAAAFARVIQQGGGSAVFASSYGSLYTSVFGYTNAFGEEFGIAILLLTIGVVIMLLNAPPKLQWLPLVLEACVTVIVLLTGARQYALVGPLVVAVVAFTAGIRLRTPLVIAGTTALLCVISYVGATRNQSVLGSGARLESISPKAALAETGGSLQTVRLFIDWRQSGDPFLVGGSYWLPFERGLSRVFPFIGRENLSSDPRAVSQMMMSRVGGLGGSAIAESYYNFGLLGCGYFVACGLLLAYMALRAQSPLAIAWEGVILYALLFQVRNWFISVPGTIVIGGLPVVVSLCFRSMRHHGHERGGRAVGLQTAPFRLAGATRGSGQISGC